MKIAILSDAHGNDIFFKKCIKDKYFSNVDEIYFLGDCFGYMNNGDEIMSILRRLNAQVLMGNHEAMLLGRIPYEEYKECIYCLNKNLENISKNNLQYIKKLSTSLNRIYNQKKILFVHGNPEEPLTGYLYEDDMVYDWSQSEYDYVFMGHTHRPYIKQVGKTTYVNVGSCGLPRDIGNAPSYVTYDTKSCEVCIHRVVLSKEEMKKFTQKTIHPKILECLMRRGNTNE